MTVTRSGRARPLSPQERRDSILDAAVPLLIAHGADVTTRQLADAAGVAEGTLFRAFPDKQAIINAAVEKYLDPQVTFARISAIPADESLENKLHALVEILRERFEGVTGILTALGLREPPPALHGTAAQRHKGRSAAVALLEPHRDELRVDPETAVHFVRLLCFANALPPIASGRETSSQEIVDLMLQGIARKGS